MTNNFYVYAYLREDQSPYYIGKGKNNRAFVHQKGAVVPKDVSRIIMLEENLDEKTAFEREAHYIRHYGRKDNGTGILINLSDGGEGAAGAIRSETTRKRMSKPKSEETKAKMRKPKSAAHRANMSKAMLNNPDRLAKAAMYLTIYNKSEAHRATVLAMNAEKRRLRYDPETGDDL